MGYRNLNISGSGTTEWVYRTNNDARDDASSNNGARGYINNRARSYTNINSDVRGYININSGARDYTNTNNDANGYANKYINKYHTIKWKRCKRLGILGKRTQKVK